ncbi:MAG: class C sortase [Parasporobacterium sp.]|nr:class C sortase [Parasporobacterium sp.]
MLYPTISDYWNSFHQSRAIMTYMEDVASMDEENYQEVIASAREYNQEISDHGIKWEMTEEEKADYEKELSTSRTGIMGYLQIEKIDLMLPIYHGIEEKVLQTSIGHIAGTSLPVGCASFNSATGELEDSHESNHIVLSGHRGLPSAKLFTNLDKLVEGDTFQITVLNETYNYEVDQIRIVLPEDLSNITLETGKDYCTLVTCTPYGINTHRLLVRGHRTANSNGDQNVIADAIQIDRLYVAPFIGIPIVTVLLIILIIVTANRRKRAQILREMEESLKNRDSEVKKE